MYALIPETDLISALKYNTAFSQSFQVGSSIMWNKILRSGFLCSIVQLTDLLTDDVIHALASDVILTRLYACAPV